MKMNASMELQDFVSMAVCGLCDDPTSVKTKISPIGETLIHIQVNCSQDDIRKVIGSKGRNIEAIRVIVAAISSKHKIKSILGIDG